MDVTVDSLELKYGNCRADIVSAAIDLFPRRFFSEIRFAANTVILEYLKKSNTPKDVIDLFENVWCSEIWDQSDKNNIACEAFLQYLGLTLAGMEKLGYNFQLDEFEMPKEKADLDCGDAAD